MTNQTGLILETHYTLEQANYQMERLKQINPNCRIVKNDIGYLVAFCWSDKKWIEMGYEIVK